MHIWHKIVLTIKQNTEHFNQHINVTYSHTEYGKGRILGEAMTGDSPADSWIIAGWGKIVIPTTKTVIVII